MVCPPAVTVVAVLGRGWPSAAWARACARRARRDAAPCGGRARPACRRSWKLRSPRDGLPSRSSRCCRCRTGCRRCRAGRRRGRTRRRRGRAGCRRGRTRRRRGRAGRRRGRTRCRRGRTGRRRGRTGCRRGRAGCRCRLLRRGFYGRGLRLFGSALSSASGIPKRCGFLFIVLIVNGF